MKIKTIVAAALGASALLAVASPAVSQDYKTAIFGHVHLPEGAHWRGVHVILCPEPFDACGTNGIQVDLDGRDSLPTAAEFFKDGLDPNTRYLPMAVKDNGDNQPGLGDFMGSYEDKNGLFPGQSGIRIFLKEVTQNQVSVAAADTPPAKTKPSAGGGVSAGAGPLVGKWAQNSEKRELVRVQTLKLVPRTGSPGMDTQSVSEYQSLPVGRSMTLTVQPDGNFVWSIWQKKPHGGGCWMDVREEKRGRLSVSGNKVTFDTRGGESSTTNTCSGQIYPTETPRLIETYNLTRTGSKLLLTEQGVRWEFTRQ